MAQWFVDNVKVDRLTLVLYVRRQDTYLESAYMQRIQHGKTLSFEEYIARRNTESFDWNSLASSLAGVVGRENLEVVPYESVKAGPAAYVNVFLERCGVPLQLTESDIPPGRSNRSYSAIALEIARRSNDLLTKEEQKVLRRFLQDNFSNVTHPRPQLLSDEARSEFLAGYARSNQILEETYFDPDLGISYGAQAVKPR